MEIIGEVLFASVMLIIGLVASVSPTRVMSFYDRFGVRSRFDERTVRWSIRSGGLIAILMAIFIFWALIYGK